MRVVSTRPTLGRKINVFQSVKASSVQTLAVLPTFVTENPFWTVLKQCFFFLSFLLFFVSQLHFIADMRVFKEKCNAALDYREAQVIRRLIPLCTHWQIQYSADDEWARARNSGPFSDLRGDKERGSPAGSWTCSPWSWSPPPPAARPTTAEGSWELDRGDSRHRRACPA